MHHLKMIWVSLWLLIAFGAGLIYAMVHWGNTNINRWTARLFGIPVLKLLGIRVELIGGESLESTQPCIYVANHQGALDIVSFGSVFPHRCVVIGKMELVFIPILNLYFFAAGNIFVNRAKRVSAVASLRKAIDAIGEKKVSVWIFPEGTRNTTEQTMLPLKKGAFHMAIEAQVPIVPVVSSPIKNLVDWERGHLKEGVIRIQVLPPVLTQGLKVSDIDSLTERVRTQMIEAIEELARNPL
jgi:lysophosphatidate acyltransferase